MLSLDFDTQTTLPTSNTLASFHWLHVPERIQFKLVTLILQVASCLASQYLVDDLCYVVGIRALFSWRYLELDWLLSVTELSVLLDRGCGTVYCAMSLSVRLSMFFVENSNISFLVCLSLDIDCLFVSLMWTVASLRFLLRPR